ncbi:YcjF family protein [Antarcticirhabdus aurantiaca]|uniref:TIGR01620 family protein n=1 Tax=Antarcticirhabdus aurantiaca TaxID=2606717 RepID=A0ACD4NV99_9HYPH|nr:TIGR01620 family protein [Antarcticirhabdus aurantiaca]WAJ30678.1 TIGR01620 family protein [Jeongeuplla avenae]
MSDADPPRRAPGAFAVPGAQPPPPLAAPPPVPVAREPRAFDDRASVTIEPDDAIEQEALVDLDVGPASPRRRRGFSFGALFVGGFGLLVSLAIGLAVDQLVRDLFARNEWLGWAALGVAGAALVGALGLAGREVAALMRLSAVDAERRATLAAYSANDPHGADTAIARLVSLLANKPETAAGRRRMAELKDEVIDGADRIALAEREILGPLDIKARALVLASAKRVSVVTAVSPKALVDVSFVLFETVRLVRRMSELYGARPGTIGLVRLTRDVFAHLAVTGSIAIGDGVVGQVIGHGLAQRLSARLGEGVVNGLLTARVGLAAMDLCRPMPFMRVRRPSIGDFAGDLARLDDVARATRQAERKGPA